jgi:hypothetical protein
MTRASSHRWIGLALACALAAGAAAQPATDARVAVEQKEALVRRLLEDSPAARRISASSDVRARSFLAAAVEQHRSALASLRAGDLAAADRQLNDAMWSAGRARQLVPDPMSRVITDRVEYARLVAGVDALRASYARHLLRAQGASAGVESEVLRQDAELERADALIDDARSLATAEYFGSAIRALQNAERGLVTALSQVLGSSTLTYTLKFETREEEYTYELDRNRSYEELVPVALTEMRPTTDVIRSVGRHVERNLTLREQAQAQAQRKDYRGALRTLRTGTGELQRALAEAGVVVPAELPAEPRATAKTN